MVRDGYPSIHSHGDRARVKMDVTVLLIEDNLAEARLLQEFLKGSVLQRFHLCHTQRLGEGMKQLATATFDIILLDLTLPDSQGLSSLDALTQRVPRLPIVVLTNTNDDELALEAVRRGAQDYLVKRTVNQDLLVRALCYAIERKQAQEVLREVNESLELRVQERTAELAAANDSLIQEIAERQNIQERLELAQKAGKIGTFEWQIASNQITWSPELEMLYGYPIDQFNNCYEDWLQTLHPDDREQVHQEFWQAVQREQALDIEFRILTPQGEIRWIAAKSQVFAARSGHPCRMLGVHIDITEKKQLEAQFLKAQRLESLGTLASGIAHDINNILTPVLAVAQLLPIKLPNLDDRNRQLLTLLETSAHRGSDLVKQILSFTRGMEGQRGILQVSHLLKEIIQIIQQTLPKTIDIQMQMGVDLWPVYADGTQLHQVFMNLCVNARDAMPQGGLLTIELVNQVVDESIARLYLDAEVGNYVLVTISDTGTGMAPEILHRIFDPFFTTKDIGQGTGLGLSAVLGIVKSHGGFIGVQSEVGQGSQFQIFLPACPSVPSVPKDAELNRAGQQELILVVDDEATICESIQNILTVHNYQVLTATSSTVAIELFNTYLSQIQCVLLDMMMPTMDGLSTLQILRQLKPDVPAILMSGLHSTEVVSQAEAAGFQEFIAKPFTQEMLLSTLQRSLQVTV
ncbi:response regulator [Alkalinema pantanalense CENA528]|uniref:hybrid sensor histidine kinase/response regulator n=1 Tax=Alkalinema pantanalense TaxID=1620705 RepID=UPI003D6E7F10